MPIPKTTQAAIFPQPVVSGPYTLSPATLLHLAALDRLGCVIVREIGAYAAAIAGFVFTRTYAELALAMTLPRDEFSVACSHWAAEQQAADLEALIEGVTRTFNAAYETAVPGSTADPTPGRPQTSAGPSKSRKR